MGMLNILCRRWYDFKAIVGVAYYLHVEDRYSA
jgi:hypothetical protein